ncbi:MULTISPECIES: hypothetical protein [Bradyrhizobium]|nr:MULTISPECIES: hypothetical protein [Bradyrhizobium]WLB89756.1 hypothetical protein QIH91_03895 [Bradyrhizobium japonicum USDA 135]
MRFLALLVLLVVRAGMVAYPQAEGKVGGRLGPFFVYLPRPA